MCYYHQHACLLVCLSLMSACLSVKLQWTIQVITEYRPTLEFKSSGSAVSNNLIIMTQVSVCQSQSNLSQNHLTIVLIQPSVIASN